MPAQQGRRGARSRCDERGGTGERAVAGQHLLHLFAQRRVDVEARGFPYERGEGCVGVESVLLGGGQEHGGAESRRVVRDRPEVPDHQIRGQEGLPPRVDGVDEGQPAAVGAVQPGPDLPRPVAVPDVRVEYGSEAVAVGRQLGGEPREETGEEVLVTAVAEEALRIPGRVEDDEPLAPAHAQGTPEPVPVRTGSQHPVEAGVPGEHGRPHGFGADLAQPGHLLGVRQHETVHERPAVGEQPLR
ncbi:MULTISPECIES: hypothetical protein [unclassified Streptomyces]|uniref:hypothetical protein n=1 Tax=unclassified Streptomyces TaxID=2593676 RepID=UPI0027E4BC79|nr:MULTISPECIES: hypothetical protein [unclassified Streptomyces]